MTSPKNATTTSKGRHYTWPPTGEQFTSVTTLIGAGVPKPALVKWAPKKAAEFVAEEWPHLHTLFSTGRAIDKKRAIDDIKGAPWRDRDAAADKGTAVHDWAERIALDPSYEAAVPEEIRGHVAQFRRFVEDFDVQFEATEFSVYSRTYGYAGTADFIARFGSRPDMGLILGDYKTNRSGIFGEIALQLAALRYADFIGLPNNQEIEIPNIDTCVGVHITADDYTVIPVQVDEYIFNYFLDAMKVAKWQTEVSNYVLDKSGVAPRSA